MTNRIDRLEKKGLVERLANPADRRGVLVALTTEGRTLIDQLVGERLQEARARVSALSAREQKQLERLLKRFLAGLSEEGQT